jgi:hypothetical protein
VLFISSVFGVILPCDRNMLKCHGMHVLDKYHIGCYLVVHCFNLPIPKLMQGCCDSLKQTKRYWNDAGTTVTTGTYR